MSSNSVFTYEGMGFFFDYDKEDQQILIVSNDAWGDPDFDDFNDPDHRGSGYWFPISKENKIRWEAFWQNASEIPETVRSAADEWIKSL